jgi:hypothetical protein
MCLCRVRAAKLKRPGTHRDRVVARFDKHRHERRVARVVAGQHRRAGHVLAEDGFILQVLRHHRGLDVTGSGKTGHVDVHLVLAAPCVFFYLMWGAYSIVVLRESMQHVKRDRGQTRTVGRVEDHRPAGLRLAALHAAAVLVEALADGQFEGGLEDLLALGAGALGLAGLDARARVRGEDLVYERVKGNDGECKNGLPVLFMWLYVENACRRQIGIAPPQPPKPNNNTPASGFW